MPNFLHRRKANNTHPLRWSAAEEKLALRLLQKRKDGGGLDWTDIRGRFPNRSTPAIKGKFRKLRILHDMFGRSYTPEKHAFLRAVANRVRPHAVFDAYAGSGAQTFLWAKNASVVYAAERVTAKQKQFAARAKRESYQKRESDLPGWLLFCRGNKSIYFWRGDALRAAVVASAHDRRADLLDLDTCGTTLPMLPTMLQLLRPRHLVISYGEFHSYRFGREDVLRRVLCHRDINSSRMPAGVDKLADDLHMATRIYALRAGNEVHNAFWLRLASAKWLGEKNKGILRRHYKVGKPPAAADCLNLLARARG